MVGHDNPRRVYKELIRFLHSCVRASVPLLEASRMRARELAGSDPVAAGMVDWLDVHIREERDHDSWLLGDWAAAGGDAGELSAALGSPAVAAMIGSVYYWVFHAHPAAVLGYCAIVEGAPPSDRFISDLQARTGYPSAAFDTLRHHSAVDVDHGGEVFHMIDTLPLPSRLESLIGMTALQTLEYLVAAGDEVLQRADRS
jgi:hypothetical protein